MKHADKEIHEGLARIGVAASSEQSTLLASYARILAERGVEFGLIADRDASRVVSRHVLDCARAGAFPQASPERQAVADLGSGAGLPGCVIAILRPDLDVVLVERRRKRAAFLEWVIEDLAMANASVLPIDIGALPPQRFRMAYARALAPAPEAWRLAQPTLEPGGALLYFAGADTEVPGALPDASRIDLVEETIAVEGSGPLVIIRNRATSPGASD